MPLSTGPVGPFPLVVHRKGGKTVTIPLAPRTARAVDLAIGERLSGAIFVDSHGQRLRRDAAARMVRRLAKRAGITKRIGPPSWLAPLGATPARVLATGRSSVRSAGDPTGALYHRVGAAVLVREAVEKLARAAREPALGAG